MKVFVTGATGQIGKRLAHFLLTNGYEIRAMVRDVDVAKVNLGTNVELVQGELSAGQDFSKLFDGIDTVIHLAGLFRGWFPLEQMIEVNTTATLHLAQAAEEAGVSKFIFASTGNVFNDSPIIGRRHLETDKPTGTRPYPATKILSEEALIKLEKQGKMQVTILRLGFVYGDGDTHIAESQARLGLWSPDKLLSVVHHADINRAIERILACAERLPHVIYHLVDDKPVTMREFYAVVDRNYLPEPDNGWVNTNIWEQALDNRLLKAEFDFEFTYPKLNKANPL